jgi:hypothetical protein
MRGSFALWVVLVLVIGIQAQAQQDAKDAKPDVKPSKRYGIEPNLELYPQSKPEETLASVLQAIERKRITYLLAHLADPDFVDNRVKKVYGGDFDEMVKETTTKLAGNPDSVKELHRFLTEGEWERGENKASASLKDIKDRKVYMRRIGKRWFLENQQQAEAAKSEP